MGEGLQEVGAENESPIGQDSRRRPALTIAVALGVLAAIAMGMWGIPAAKSAVDNCTQQELSVGIVKANGCWTTSGTTRTTTRAFDLNGFTITPSESAPFTIDTATRQATTKGKPVGFAATPIKFSDTPFDFEIPTQGDVQFKQVEILPGLLAGFGIVANTRINASVTDGGGSIDVPIELGNVLTIIGKNQAVTTKVNVAPGQGAKYDGIKINLSGIPSNKVIPFGLESFEARYSLSQNTWGGSATITLPPKDVGVQAGFTITNGKLSQFSFGISNINLQLASAVYLQRIAGQASTDPFTFDATIGLTAGPKFKIFGNDVSLLGVEGTLTIQPTKPNISTGFVGIGGNASLINIPVSEFNLKVYFNGSVDYHASTGIAIPEFRNDPNAWNYIGMGLDGWFAFPRFNLYGNGKVRILGQDTAGAKAVISDRGIAACGYINVAWWDVATGIGYRWGNALPDFPGCDLGPYGDWDRPTTRLLRQGHQRATAHLGPRKQVLKIEGRDDVPGFSLSSDDADTTIVSPATDEDGQEVEESHMVLPSDDTNEVIVLLDDPEGDWTLEEHPGTDIVSVQRASVLRPERVEAEVRGHGKRRTLVWDARDFDGQKLQFAERLSNGVVDPILLTGKASGRHRFTPEQGGFYGKRELEVQVLQQGGPRARLALDDFHVSAPPIPKAPRGLEVRRRGHDVTARWSQSAGAKSYTVLLESADGDLRLGKTLGPGRHRATFANAPLTGHMVVKVYAHNRDDDQGRPAKQRFDVS